ncbi:acyl carrier protein (partial match) [Frankia alni ACN14a]|uniref:Acyl carrier protein n=1 Tax=Frankia alni (strain DSM 45986 / CECT 9034 / ACN14a) TaxID=326424 RepID=Q0RAU0_FRAAA|nr:acyl carrier protein (partial match) [Frankia alni ACN14a]
MIVQPGSDSADLPRAVARMPTGLTFTESCGAVDTVLIYRTPAEQVGSRPQRTVPGREGPLSASTTPRGAIRCRRRPTPPRREPRGRYPAAPCRRGARKARSAPCCAGLSTGRDVRRPTWSSADDTPVATGPATPAGPAWRRTGQSPRDEHHSPGVGDGARCVDRSENMRIVSVPMHVGAGGRGVSTVEERVKNVVVEQLNVKPAEVTNNASFVEDLGADSLDLVELGVALEEEFSIGISDEDAAGINTVQDAIDWINARWR